VAQLEEKTAEYQSWLARREEFSRKAQQVVVTIYARMRPDAAAAQLVAMDEEMAAAVLTKLEPRNASLILNEMDAAQAARLTATIGGAANVNLPGRPRAQGREKRS
jgi:flagellar motility protein MotE (MotC chaperone)